MYTVADQPGIPDNQKTIVKTEEVTQRQNMTIDDLLRDYDEAVNEIAYCKTRANEVVDELTAIDLVLPVNIIPVRL